MSVSILQQIKGKLVVSCQALEHEPLHSDFIMSRMAVAAEQGGAAAIRANSLEDVKAILRSVELPVIGIIKRDYPGSEVYITATMTEIDELMIVAPQMIALDATFHQRPGERGAANAGADDHNVEPHHRTTSRRTTSRAKFRMLASASCRTSSASRSSSCAAPGKIR